MAGVVLHILLDLPLHHDDAHRHFFPFSGIRFESPISYWDPDHFGLFFIFVELIFALSACIFVVRHGGKPMRWLAGANLLIYLAAMTAAVLYLLRRSFAE